MKKGMFHFEKTALISILLCAGCNNGKNVIFSNKPNPEVESITPAFGNFGGDSAFRSCSLPNGDTIPHLGFSWKLTSNANLQCESIEFAQCNDGAIQFLSQGNTTNQCNSPTTSSTGINCSLDGYTIPHSHTVVSFDNTNQDSPTCIGKIRRCDNGDLSGSATYNMLKCIRTWLSKNDSGQQNAACSLNGQLIPYGSFVITYREANPRGLCDFKPQVCLGPGSLDSNFSYLSCKPSDLVQ